VRCLALVLLLGLFACSPRVKGLALREDLDFQLPETGASLRGISASSSGDGLWATGSGGTVLRSADRGRSWRLVEVPGAEELDFRDVHAFGADLAVIMAAGTGGASRVFRTTDGGATWTETLRNPDPEGFFDGMAFWNRSRGILYGDPVDGAFSVWITGDGGQSWQRVRSPSLGAAEGEHAFAASGTGIAVQGRARAWFVTGGAVARAFRSEDGGRTWRVSPLPLAQGRPSAGAFGVAFVSARQGGAVGGDFERPDSGEGSLAITRDGGRSWTAVDPGFSGYRSGVVEAVDGALVAVGPTGCDSFRFSEPLMDSLPQGGHSITHFGDHHGTWISGPDGRVTPIDVWY